MNIRFVLAIFLPFLACAIQWLLWDPWIKPYVWFLFFPAAFFSAWLGGLKGGLLGTSISALLAWFVFIPPPFSFILKAPSAGASVALFVIMGGLFSWLFQRLTEAKQRTDEALKATEEANAKITRLYEKTLELDKLKSQFFANISHELRTPLTLIMAPLQHQLSQDALQGEARKQVELMLRNARLLYRHISDLLDAAKLEAGGMRPNYARVDLAELVRVVASYFDSMARERNIHYRIAAPVILVGEVDSEKIERVVLNLLSNAFKFIGDGGHIAVRLQEKAGQAFLEVQDDGPGIPANQREMVFERFHQIEGDATRTHGGTGLGLAIVKEFVELHGGHAGVCEAPVRGALFFVYLPLKAPAGVVVQEQAHRPEAMLVQQHMEELHTPTEPENGPDTGHAPLVLVVEDNADMAAFIAGNLQPYYRVLCARDGRAGLTKALALKPDLILADIMMPVMSGDEMLARLREQPETAHIPVIILSAKADDALRIQLLQTGAQDYLTKPFRVEELLARVDGLLSAQRRNAEQLDMSETRFRQLFEQAPIALSTSNREGRIVRMNQAFTKLFGYRMEELGSVEEWRKRVLPDDGARQTQNQDWQNKWLERTHGTAQPARYEQKILCKNGSSKFVLMTRQHLGEDMMLAAVDISPLKAVEEELRQRNEELERFDQASVGRELRMIELKRQVNALAETLGQAAPYPLTFIAEPRQTGEAP